MGTIRIYTKNNKYFDLLVPSGTKYLNWNPSYLGSLALSNGAVTSDALIPESDTAVVDSEGNLLSAYKITHIDCDCDEVDYGGLTLTSPGIAATTNAATDTGAVKSIYNLNFNATGVRWESNKVCDYTGDIIINGTGVSGTSCLRLFNGDALAIQKARGILSVKNIGDLYMVCGLDDNNYEEVWFNVVDLRDVDTSSCKQMNILNRAMGDCTVILGNFSNESVTGSMNLFMYGNADKVTKEVIYTRNIVMTNFNPNGDLNIAGGRKIPVLKNCAFTTSNGQTIAEDRHADTYDWVTYGRIANIYVPEDLEMYYEQDTYINGGTKGNTGWSYWYKNGKIKTYNPETQFTERIEDGKRVWIYRK